MRSTEASARRPELTAASSDEMLCRASVRPRCVIAKRSEISLGEVTAGPAFSASDRKGQAELGVLTVMTWRP